MDKMERRIGQVGHILDKVLESVSGWSKTRMVMGHGWRLTTTKPEDLQYIANMVYWAEIDQVDVHHDKRGVYVCVFR